MTRSLEARLARVTSHMADKKLADASAEAAIHAGTASLDDYRIYTKEIQAAEREFMARTPLLVALVSAGVWKWGADLPLAFPPDAELSESTEGLAAFVWNWAEIEGNKGIGQYTWEHRRDCAILYLAMGAERNALPLREKIWTQDGQRWVLSSEVIEAATTLRCTSYPGDPLLHPNLRSAVSNPTEPTTPPGCLATRTWADAARKFEAMGWSDRHYGEWSDQVKSGQYP